MSWGDLSSVTQQKGDEAGIRSLLTLVPSEPEEMLPFFLLQLLKSERYFYREKVLKMHKTERCDMVIDVNEAGWSEAAPAAEESLLLAPGRPGAGQQASSSTGL